jgi:hypothetical protein
LEIDNTKVATQTKIIPAKGTEVFYLSWECSGTEHDMKAFLEHEDGLEADNVAYALIPESLDLNVLLIRERESDEHIKYALESLEDVSLSESFAPVYPQSYEYYDTIIFQEASSENILTGTFEEIKGFVEGGGSLVVLGFKGLYDLSSDDIAGILPVEIEGVSQVTTKPYIIFDHMMLNDVDFEEISVFKSLYTQDRMGSITLATANGNPILSMHDVGNGEVVFLGVSSNASWSDFYLKPSFPVFWYQLLFWLNREDTVGNALNFRTGEQLPFLINDSIRVIKPSGDIIEGVDILLDEGGFYEIEGYGQRRSASLQDESESDISYFEGDESVEFSDNYVAVHMKEKIRHEMYWLLAIAALLLLVFEWFYYKWWGSL